MHEQHEMMRRESTTVAATDLQRSWQLSLSNRLPVCSTHLLLAFAFLLFFELLAAGTGVLISDVDCGVCVMKRRSTGIFIVPQLHLYSYMCMYTSNASTVYAAI